MSKGSTSLPFFGFLFGVVFILMLLAIATPEAVDDPGLATQTAEKGAMVRDLGDIGVKLLWVTGFLGFFKFIVIDYVGKGVLG